MTLREKVSSTIEALRTNPRQAFSPLLEAVKTPPGILATLSVAGMILAGSLSYRHESYRGTHLPLAFSEIHQLEKDAEKAFTELNPLTQFYAKANDATMKVFESWNQSHETKDPPKEFALLLANRLGGRGTVKKFHYNLKELLDQLPPLGRDLLGRFAPHQAAREGIHLANRHLDRAWTEYHQDHNKTVVVRKSRTVTDGKGNSRTEYYTTTEQVYSHTTHTYTYYRAQGESASHTLDALLAKTLNLTVKQTLMRPSQIGKENQEAIAKSRKKKELNLLELASTWATGSTFSVNYPVMMSAWTSLPAHADRWRVAKGTAHSTWYITYSRVDFGPREFQVAEQALANGRKLERALSNLLGGLSAAVTDAPLLEKKITSLITSLTEPGKDQKALAEDVLQTAQALYAKNFQGGFDVAGFRWYMIVLLTLLGGMGGSAMGFGGILTYEKATGRGF